MHYCIWVEDIIEEVTEEITINIEEKVIIFPIKTFIITTDPLKDKEITEMDKV